MLHRFQIYITVGLALCVSLLSSRCSMAQNDNRILGSFRSSSQNFTETPYIPPSANYRPFNGYDPSYYYLSPSRGVPTYMTSINYPWVYGAYDYPHPPGIFQPSMQRPPFTSSPNLYSVSATPPSLFGPGERLVDTALIPVQTTASVNVWVPADAELRFEGTRTEQRGMFRRFTTPPLIPGREYTYDINATWTENGQQVTRTRHVPVRAGDRLYVDFRRPEAAEEATSTLRTRPLP